MMTLIDPAGVWSAYLTRGVVVLMFGLFLWEQWPTEVVALGGVALLLVLGLLPYEAGLNVLSNPAPWTEELEAEAGAQDRPPEAQL